MSGPLGFLASNTHYATRNPKFRIEKNQNAAKAFFSFFSLHLNLGAKFWTEIELLSLTKLCQTFCPLTICLINKKPTPMGNFIPCRFSSFYQCCILLSTMFRTKPVSRSVRISKRTKQTTHISSPKNKTD